MKIRPFFAVLLSVTVSSLALAVDVSPVVMDVKPVTGGRSANFVTTQTRSLNVALTNGSAEDLSLSIKYYFFVRNVNGGKLALLKSGEKAFDLKAHSILTVPTETVTAKCVQAHYENVNQNNYDPRNPQNHVNRMIPASGERIAGYGVQLLQNGKVLVERYSEPSLKAASIAAAK